MQSPTALGGPFPDVTLPTLDGSTLRFADLPLGTAVSRFQSRDPTIPRPIPGTTARAARATR